MKSRIGIIIDPKATTDHTTNGQRRHPDHGQSHIQIGDGKGGVHALVERVHTTLFSDTSRQNVLKVLLRKVAVNRLFAPDVMQSHPGDLNVRISFHDMMYSINDHVSFTFLRETRQSSSPSRHATFISAIRATAFKLSSHFKLFSQCTSI